MAQTFKELPESEATGDIARIYGELRLYYGAPYVSSLQRHLATWPGSSEMESRRSLSPAV